MPFWRGLAFWRGLGRELGPWPSDSARRPTGSLWPIKGAPASRLPTAVSGDRFAIRVPDPADQS